LADDLPALFPDGKKADTYRIRIKNTCPKGQAVLLTQARIHAAG
jgi:hypothetical protein